MPIHDNDLQIVATAIQRYYAPTGASVTPRSRKLRDGTGTSREIDVLVEYEFDSRRQTIAVEAKDWKLPVDQPTVEGYIGKYNSVGGIRVDKVIIVGRRFTQPAEQRAALIGFELQTIERLQTQTVSLFSPEENDGTYQSKSDPTKDPDKVVPFLIGADNKGVKPDPREEGFLVHRHTGKNCGRPSQWADRYKPSFLRAVNKARAERHGVAIRGEMEISLAGYSLRRMGKDTPLKLLALVTSSTAIIPQMTAQEHRNVIHGVGERNVVVETHDGPDGRIEIIYERPEAGQSPKGFHFHATGKDGSPGLPTATLKISI